MNNDSNTTSSVVGCSSNTTTATGNATAGSGSAADAVNANDTNLSTIAGHSTTTISTTSPSIYTSASAAKPTAAVPTTGPNDDKSKKSDTWEESRLKDWDDCRFKHLLDEAYSYKNPRDKENKSQTFLQLLQKAQKADNEKEDQKYSFRALTSRYTPRNSTSNSQKQGGSLQDLVEAVRNESLDSDISLVGPRNRRHNHNSRPKKYSLVSSRQREGGSLPSNVNVSNCSLSVYEQPFLNEEKSKQRRTKNQPRIVTNSTNTAACLTPSGGTSPPTAGTGNLVSGCTGPATTTTTTACTGVLAEVSAAATNICSAINKKDSTVVSGGCAGVCEGAIGSLSLAATIGSATSATCAALATATAVVSDSGDTVIEMGENCIDPHNDLIAQGIQFDRFDGIEMKIPRANIIGSVLTRNDFSPNNNTTCYVDEAVHFTTLERGKSTVDASNIPLDENYKACKSVLGEKSELVKMQSFSATKTISKQFDENGNSLNTTYTISQSQAKAKKKKPQSERNTKTLDVQSVEGYRGSDPIEELVKYIESSEDTKQNDKVSKFADNSNKKKERKKDKDKEKEKSKMKRSNSLEELRSCSKLDGDDVTMRHKSITIKTKNLDGKEKQAVQALGNTGTNRKGERRSWGTEELTYLKVNNAIEEVREKVKDKEKKKSKEKDKDFCEKLEKVVEKRKKSEPNLVESVSSESAAEFHVVTKKKKPKKQRQIAEDGRNNNSGNVHKNPMYQNRKYHSNFSNDHDADIGSFTNNTGNDKSRRKSTSSMPPSEKSDSSDLDSVHSLPIESAGGRSPLQVHHQNQPRSYAEIARKTETIAAIVSPGAGVAIDSTASNTSSNNSSHTELEIKAPVVVLPANITATTKKAKKSLKTDFPELISNDGGGGALTVGNTISNTSATKQISYSQSLTSKTKADEIVVENMPQKLSSPDAIKTVIEKYQPVQQQQQQSHQQQIALQKSKSVETDSFYNSIDQYPALEKTVKRHSAASACVSEVGIVTINPPHSAMISVQMNSISNNMGCISNTAPQSKKSKANTKANEEVLPEQQQQQQQHQQQQQQQQPQHQMTKKSKKEKASENYAYITQSIASTTSFSPAAAAATNINNKNQINHNHHYNFSNKSSCSNSHNINNNNNNNSNSSNNNSCNNNKFSNRPAVIILNDDTTAGGLSSCIGNEFTFGDFNEEELRLFDDSQPQQLQQQHQLQPPPPSSHSEISQKRYSATIISSLQSFDDSGGNFNITDGSNASDVANNSDDAMLLMHHTSSPNSSLVIDQSSDSGICNNYDGGAATKGKRMNQQTIGTTAPVQRSTSTDAARNIVGNSFASTSPSKESLSSASSSSSSTSSWSSTHVNVPVSFSKSCTSTSAAATTTTTTGKTSKSTTTSLNSPNSNQQPQTHLDISKTKTTPSSLCNTPSKESLSSASSSSSSSSSSSTSSWSSTHVNVPVSFSKSCTSTSVVTPTTTTTGKTSKSTTTATSSSPNYNNQQQTHLDINKSKATSSSLSNSRVSTMNKRNSQQQQQTSSSNCIAASSLPSQQLETCDDIESAIIAAAKKAAAVAAEQTTTASVIKKKSNNNILGSTTTTTTTQLNINSNNANHFNSFSSGQAVTSPPSSFCQNSNNKEYNSRRAAASAGTATGQQHQRKEIDVHFIPPTLATAITSIQNNETIINFIGSAWEEVANSKVTQFYDGQ